MIDEILSKIESAAQKIEDADPKRKAELLRHLNALKTELRGPNRAPRKPSLKALADSVTGLEASHPALARAVDEICRELAALGI